MNLSIKCSRVFTNARWIDSARAFPWESRQLPSIRRDVAITGRMSALAECVSLSDDPIRDPVAFQQTGVIRANEAAGAGSRDRSPRGSLAGERRPTRMVDRLCRSAGSGRFTGLSRRAARLTVAIERRGHFPAGCDFASRRVRRTALLSVRHASNGGRHLSVCLR